MADAEKTIRFKLEDLLDSHGESKRIGSRIIR